MITKDVYGQFGTPDNLQVHMLAVAGPGALERRCR